MQDEEPAEYREVAIEADGIDVGLVLSPGLEPHQLTSSDVVHVGDGHFLGPVDQCPDRRILFPKRRRPNVIPPMVEVPLDGVRGRDRFEIVRRCHRSDSVEAPRPSWSPEARRILNDVGGSGSIVTAWGEYGLVQRR